MTATTLDLDRPRDGIELFGTGFSLWSRHGLVFVALAAVVVVPAAAAVRALPDGELESLARVLADIVVPALVSAVHAAAVLDLGRGTRPSLRRSVARVAPLAGPVALVAALFTAGVTLGSLLLVAPGILLAVRWWFGAQAVVVDGVRGREALRHSGRLVAHRWGRVFALLLVLGGLPSIARGVLDALAGDGALAQTVLDCAVLSYTALVGTLLFFDLRATSDPVA